MATPLGKDDCPGAIRMSAKDYTALWSSQQTVEMSRPGNAPAYDILRNSDGVPVVYDPGLD